MQESSPQHLSLQRDYFGIPVNGPHFTPHQHLDVVFKDEWWVEAFSKPYRTPRDGSAIREVGPHTMQVFFNSRGEPMHGVILAPAGAASRKGTQPVRHLRDHLTRLEVAAGLAVMIGTLGAVGGAFESMDLVHTLLVSITSAPLALSILDGLQK